MITLYGIKNCDTIKKPDAGWKHKVLTIAFMIIASTVLTIRYYSPLSAN